MGWDGSGNFNRTNGVFTGNQVWQNSRDGGRRIRADDHDTHDQDLADGLENTVTRDGQNSPSTNLPMANFRHTSVGTAVARNDYAAAGQVQDDSFTFVVPASVGGTGDAITLTPAPAISAYTAGQKFAFVVESNNTGAVTVNISGLGTQAITKLGTTALAADDLPTGQLVCIQYDGTRFQLMHLTGTAAAVATTIGATSLAGNNTFTGNNEFTGDFTVSSDDAGATAAPIIILDRNSASPADNDFLGQIPFRGRNDAVTPEEIDFASIQGQILDFTDGTEDGQGILRAQIAGTNTDVLSWHDGVQVGAPTGGYQGAGTISAAAGVYDNGGRLRLPYNETVALSGGQLTSTNAELEGRTWLRIVASGVSLSATGNTALRLRAGGAFITTGYPSASPDKLSAFYSNGFGIDQFTVTNSISIHRDSLATVLTTIQIEIFINDSDEATITTWGFDETNVQRTNQLIRSFSLGGTFDGIQLGSLVAGTYGSSIDAGEMEIWAF